METNDIVKALREHAECRVLTNEWETPITLDDDLSAAADRLEELLGRCARYAEEIVVLWERQRWIPVTERLPEDGQDVLCWYEYFRYGDYNAMFATYGIGYQYFGHWGGEVSHGTNARVLAWMPLPPALEED